MKIPTAAYECIKSGPFETTHNLKMQFSRWKFSKYCQKELEEFMKTVDRTRETETDAQKYWKQILPPDEELLRRFESSQRSADVEAVDLTIDSSDDDHNVITEAHETLCEVHNEDLSYLVDALRADIKDEVVSEETVTQLNALNDKQLEYVFSKFQNVDIPQLRNLYITINDLVDFETHRILKAICEVVIVEKVINKPEENEILDVLLEIVALSPEIINDHVVIPVLLREDSPIIQSLLKGLNRSQKTSLLSKFMDSCSQLETHHFSSLLLLLFADTDFATKKQIARLIETCSLKFSEDAAFIKFIIGFIEKLGKESYDLESALRAAIASNNSLLKGRAESALLSWLNTK